MVTKYNPVARDSAVRTSTPQDTPIKQTAVDQAGEENKPLPLRRCAGDSMAKFHLLEPDYVAWHCPGCEGGHAVPVTGHSSGRGWDWNRSFESPTLTPSVLVNVGGANPTAPICHVFIRDGMIEFLRDCTHKLAGQTVPVPDWDE